MSALWIGILAVLLVAAFFGIVRFLMGSAWAEKICEREDARITEQKELHAQKTGQSGRVDAQKTR